MKRVFLTFLLTLFLSSTLFAQNFTGFTPKNDQGCLSKKERITIVKEIKNNINTLKKEKRLIKISKRSKHTLFSWPLKKANNCTYNMPWAISFYVDQNRLQGLKDYNNKQKTYEQHAGTDIFIWPYSWKMVEEGMVNVVAAAAGQIIYKQDGKYDKNCEMINGAQWNAVYIKHSDGSVAWYGHMKKGSLTSKKIGDYITEGEYLGKVASSGFSNGPHLHFEVHKNHNIQNDNDLIDPFSGPGNSLNSDSWWKNQLSYSNPEIMAVTIGDRKPIIKTCPNPEKPYAKNEFERNTTIYISIYLRDPKYKKVKFTVYKPDNSISGSPFSELINSNSIVINGTWTRQVDMVGEWRVVASIEGGGTVTKKFYVKNKLGLEDLEITSSVKVHPNPAVDFLTIDSETLITKARVTSTNGRVILEKSNDKGIQKVTTKNLAPGLYLITIQDNQKRTKIIKFIKK